MSQEENGWEDRLVRGGIRLGKMPYPDKLRAWLREDWRVRSVVPGTGKIQDSSALAQV